MFYWLEMITEILSFLQIFNVRKTTIQFFNISKNLQENRQKNYIHGIFWAFKGKLQIILIAGIRKIAPQKIGPYENTPLWIFPLWKLPPGKITPSCTSQGELKLGSQIIKFGKYVKLLNSQLSMHITLWILKKANSKMHASGRSVTIVYECGCVLAAHASIMDTW